MDSLPESTCTTFKHEPLPAAANHMRLLEVLDETYSDSIEVCCEMTAWPSDSKPPYHAMSYTGGDQNSNTTILINDQPFSVRKNREFVLKQARWLGKSRYYWVDAICIDQENLNEESKQVEMMGKIYKRAEHVLAYVGDHTEDSLILFENFGRVSPCVNTWKSFGRHNLFTLGLYLKLGIRTTQRFICACMNFAKRPYFTRLWVLQEMRMPGRLVSYVDEVLWQETRLNQYSSFSYYTFEKLSRSQHRRPSRLHTDHIKGTDSLMSRTYLSDSV